MVMMRVKVDGIYDSRTLKSLTEISLAHFSFDFRPTSFSFLQEHQFVEILTRLHSPLGSYFLRYEGDPDFVIEKMLTEIKELEHKGSIETFDNILLEFSDQRSSSFLDSFSWPYILHYYPGMNLPAYLQSGNLRGIVLSLDLLMRHQQSRSLHTFVKEFYQMLRTHGVSDSFFLILAADWDSDILPSFQDYFDFDLISLPINGKVESCYRNVNLKDLTNHCRYFAAL
jgi:hypothetical protein